MPLQNGYDAVAWCYDLLKSSMLGNGPEKAEAHFLPLIGPGSRVLIVGGGTGAILERIAMMHPGGLQITYVDASPRMVAAAKRRNCGGNAVSFCTANIQDTSFAHEFDVVITSFLLDNFTNNQLYSIFQVLSASLKPAGRWIDTDFRHSGNRWHSFVVRFMYYFFRKVCMISACELPNVDNLFVEFGFSVIGRAFYQNKFICTTAFVDKKYEEQQFYLL